MDLSLTQKNAINLMKICHKIVAVSIGFLRGKRLMKIEKYVVILTSENGDKTHLKMSVNREGKTAEIHLAEQVKTDGDKLYIFGEEITKQALKPSIND